MLVALAWHKYYAFSEGTKPNILFILTDDQGYGDLSCYGAKDMATPNIDRLAAEGMTFKVSMFIIGVRPLALHL